MLQYLVIICPIFASSNFTHSDFVNAACVISDGSGLGVINPMFSCEIKSCTSYIITDYRAIIGTDDFGEFLDQIKTVFIELFRVLLTKCEERALYWCVAGADEIRCILTMHIVEQKKEKQHHDTTSWPTILLCSNNLFDFSFLLPL